MPTPGIAPGSKVCSSPPACAFSAREDDWALAAARPVGEMVRPIVGAKYRWLQGPKEVARVQQKTRGTTRGFPGEMGFAGAGFEPCLTRISNC